MSQDFLNFILEIMKNYTIGKKDIAFGTVLKDLNDNYSLDDRNEDECLIALKELTDEYIDNGYYEEKK